MPGTGPVGGRSTPATPGSAVAKQHYHSLDALRAAMMLLGLYLHTVMSYGTIGAWPWKPAALTGSLNFSLLLIHVFRMPVFFLLAGFFAALLVRSRALRQAAENRLRRILVPLLVSWAAIFPLVAALTALATVGWNPTSLAAAFSAFLGHARPLHLWFLEYLLLLYVSAAVAIPSTAILPVRLRAALNRLFRTAVQSRSGPALFALPSFAALLPMRFVGFDDPSSFVPAPRIVLAYAIPFAFGWLLFRNLDLFDLFRRRAWAYAAASVLVFLIHLGLRQASPGASAMFFAERALHSVALWCFTFALLGLSLRYFDRPDPVWRYLCEASYFLYLAHVPVILGLQLLLDPLAAPPLAKIPAVLAGTLAILLLTYHYAVRPSFIGAALNGRKHPPARRPGLPLTPAPGRAR